MVRVHSIDQWFCCKKIIRPRKITLQSWTKRVENIKKRGYFAHCVLNIAHYLPSPSPLQPMLISPGSTCFVLSSNIDKGGGGGGQKESFFFILVIGV